MIEVWIIIFLIVVVLMVVNLIFATLLAIER